MKRIIRFAAMAATMIAMCVSCEKASKEKENDSISMEGKQYSFSFKYGGMYDATGVLDLGVNMEGFAMVLMNLPAMTGEDYMPLTAGNYTVEAKDATSGKISIVDPMDPAGLALVINYSSLTKSSVVLSCETEILALPDVTATLLEENIMVEGM